MTTRVEPLRIGLAILTVLGLGVAMLMLMPLTAFAQEGGEKVFICKYVGTPGEDETLQTGDNPISVSVNAVPIYDKNNPDRDTAEELVGRSFEDEQGRSLVIAVDVGQPEPSCPGGTTTTTTVPEEPETFSLVVVKAWAGDDFVDDNLQVTLLIDGVVGPVEVEHGDTVSISESVTGLPEICTYESDAPGSFTVDEADAVEGVITLTITNTVDCEDEVLANPPITPSTTAPAVQVTTTIVDEVLGTQVTAEELPFTGIDSDLLLVLGAFLLASGLVALGITGRREET